MRDHLLSELKHPEESTSERQSDRGRAARRPIELAVIAPSFNERDNIRPLTQRLEKVLAGIAWELIIVDDDSPDGTAALVRELSQENDRIRVIQRVGRRGLATAVIEGMLATSAPYLAVIDADMQHDEALLPDMLEIMRGEDTDVVVGSRYLDQGGFGEWSQQRISMSEFATKLSRLVVKSDLTDPMSGFFMISRDAFERSMRNLSGEGYKILLDLFASAPEPLKFKELPYEFRTRERGESKLDTMVLWEFVTLIIDKTFGHILPARLIMFGMVGMSGVAVHMGIFALCFFLLSTSFLIAQTAGTVVAMTSNFFLNNILTYRDRRLKGLGIVVGLISFYLVSSVGLIGNVGIANYLYKGDFTWWISTFAGIAIGIIWNYTASAIFTWKQK